MEQALTELNQKIDALTAQVAYLTEQYPTSVHCWQEAFQADPGLETDLRGGYRYEAACAAALAGPAFHDQALAWFRAELETYRAMPAPDTATLERLRARTFDPDLVFVRDVDGLPEAWRALWADVHAVLAQGSRGC